MTTYKELLMSRDAFLELRTKICHLLDRFPELPGGEIDMVKVDLDTGDLLVTSQFASGQRTHRLIIKDETVNVSRGTSKPDNAHDLLVEIFTKWQGWDEHMMAIAERAATLSEADEPSP